MGSRNKSWIDDLLEPLKNVLTSPEKIFIKNVFSTAMTEAKSRIVFCSENDDEIDTKISILKENLMIIIDQLEQFKESKNDFIQKFPKWFDLRRKNVESLKSLGNSMHGCRKYCNISRLAGNSTSLIGGAACIASTISIPLTFGLTTPLVVAGGTMVILGSATSAGSSLTEIKIMSNKIQTAKCILNNDKTSLEDLLRWLKDANDFSEAIKSISRLDIGDHVVNTMCKSIGVATDIQNIVEGKERAINFVKLYLNILKCSLFRNALQFGQLVSFLAAYALLYNKNNYVIDHVFQTAASIAGYVSLLRTSTNIKVLISKLIKTDAKISSNVIKATSKRTVAAIGISVDIASIVLTSIDVYNGSLSEKGAEIIKIAEKLEEETDTLQEVYDKVIKTP